MHFCSVKIIFFPLFLLLVTLCESVYYIDRTGSTCFSANDDSSRSFFSIELQHHETIRELEKFTGCETIIGNLILMNIKDPDGTKLHFFSSVKKITGYIAVINCTMRYLPFPNLHIISGQNLIPKQKKPRYALFVTLVNETWRAGLDNLREVSSGDVLIENNSNNLTGYSDLILWDDIMSDNATATVTPLVNNTDFNLTDYTCHPDCKHPGRCWGPELINCQHLSMEVCQDQCPGGRCYFADDSPDIPICCHKECSGGCTGMTNADCFGCKNFDAAGQCVTNCPPPKIYDRGQFKMVDNPDVLYGLGNECLEECPNPFLVEEGNCVKKCSDHLMTEHHTNKCVLCPSEGCPKRCDGFTSVSELGIGRCNEYKPKMKRCSAAFKNKYQNCTIIEGSIDIDSKFTDKFGEMASDALEALSTVEEITGYLSIHTNNLFSDFSFLRNLKRIRGIHLKSSYSYESCEDEQEGCRVNLQAAITVQAFQDYALTELRLNSLELIENGMVIIYANGSALCYLPEKEALAGIMKKPDLNPQLDIIITYNSSYCRAHEKLCHDTCIGGCWGVGPENCVQCSRLSFEGKCLTTCNDPAVVGQGIALYEDGNNCKKCHTECDPTSNCTGPESNQCSRCRNYKDGPYCVDECPDIKYTNELDTCMECHDKCTMERGCTGPNSFIGPGGCNFCEVVKLMEETYTENNTRRLWGQCEVKCPEDQYPDNFKPYPNLPTHDGDRPISERVKVCTPCHKFCSSCRSSGYSIHVCTCKYAQDGENCVGQCPAGKWRSLVDKTCRPCDGPCPKNCVGSDTVPLNSSSIVQFANCNLVEGSVIINFQSWTGPDKITTADLEALDEIVTITGRLIIRDSPDTNFTSLDMFRRLAEVKGEGSLRRRRRRATDDYVIEIDNNTALETAELVALKKIGGPMKLSGSNLCYVDRVDWGSRLDGSVVTVDISESACTEKPCHSECDETDGCLGPDSDMCITCNNKEFEGDCIPTCQGASYDDESVQCKPCHKNCNTCTGPGNHHCIDCKHMFDGPACVTSCSNVHSYVRNQRCEECDPACEGGCDGPGAHKGVGGCTTCKLFDNTINKEDQMCADQCPPKSYKDTIKGEDDQFITVCEKCHGECAACDHWSDSSCTECVHVKQGDRCQAKCDLGYYEGPDKKCLECHEECASCIGPGETSCTSCMNFELPTSEIKQTRTCVAKCPEQYSRAQKVVTTNELQHLRCVEECENDGNTQRDGDFCSCIEGRACPGMAPRESSTAVAIAVGVAIVFIIVIVGIICWKRAKQNQKKRMNLLKHAQQMHDNINPIYEPVMQEDTVYPLNDGQLLIVTEDSLEIGEVLGSGAFGKVYEGRWHPTETLNTADDVGLRVAIKILKDSGDPESTREFFDEAVVMGKLDHKHLVRILCLCAGKMMLVTQLMPLGSLLDYVRKYKSSITSHHLLTYGLQIARGMAYLEENNVVHRDLAARNVLVQTPTFVKITDFGLAKCLSSKKQMFTSEGGKLPIKWLAIESLKYRQFTSRSDTWSYGVTIWEVLEFGQLPWRTKPPAELIRSLEMGERLPKPKTCTLEVYALMLRCWVLEPTARPNFEDLMCSMEEFLKEPNRFVHTPHTNRASTEGSFLSPHASVTSEYRDSGIVDVDRNYENDDRAMAMQRALYDATSSLRPQESSPNYDPALTADQDDVFSESPSTARNSVIENRHDYVQDYLVPDQYSVDEGNGTDSSQDQGYVKMGNGSDYADLEQQPEYSNADTLLEGELTQSLLEHSKQSSKNNKNKFPYNRSPSPRPAKHLSPKPPRNAQSSPRVGRIRDDGYSSLKEPLSDVSVPLTGEGSTENL